MLKNIAYYASLLLVSAAASAAAGSVAGAAAASSPCCANAIVQNAASALSGHCGVRIYETAVATSCFGHCTPAQPQAQAAEPAALEDPAGIGFGIGM